MTERRQKLRGTTAQLDADLGLEGMLAYNTELRELRVYDGVLLGGYRIPNSATLAALYTLPDRLDTDGMTLGSGSADTTEQNGFYRTGPATVGVPVAANGTLIVQVGGSFTAQTWIHTDNSAVYRRTKPTAGAWSAWLREVDTTYLTTNAAAIAYDANRLDGQDGTYYTNIVARLGYTPLNKGGDTMLGVLTLDNTLTLKGTGTNQFQNGNADAASYTQYNFALQGWFGMGMKDHTGTVRGFYDFRAGKWDIIGGFFKNGVEAVYNNGGTYAINVTGNSGSSTLATKASTLSQNGGNGAAMTFNWSGQGGQPTWLWGGNDGSNHYVYNPSNFSVAFAANAGTLDGIDSTGFVQNGEIGTKYAGIGYGDIGTVAMLRYLGPGNNVQGDVVSGNQLCYSNADGSNSSIALSGLTHWLCCSRTVGNVGGAAVGIFRRID